MQADCLDLKLVNPYLLKEYFTQTFEQKLTTFTLLVHQWILYSEWVPSEWAQTVDKNITINPHHSSPLIIVLWSEKMHFCNKQIHL